MLEGMSRAALNVQDKQVEKESANATSQAGKKIQGMLNRMNKPREKLHDYLTPMRHEREYQESLRGDYTVDFKKQWQKAKVKSSITSKQPVFLTHLRDDRQLSLQHKVEDVNVKEVKKHQKNKGKSSGKEAIYKEIEMIKRQRIQQKRYTKAEVVSRELMNLCYNLLEHLQKMKQCSYICEGIKQGHFGSQTVIRVMVNREMKQIHELDAHHLAAHADI